MKISKQCLSGTNSNLFDSIGCLVHVSKPRSEAQTQKEASDVALSTHSSFRHDAPRNAEINVSRANPPMSAFVIRIFKPQYTRVLTQVRVLEDL
jgi:hypothetical protein